MPFASHNVPNTTDSRYVNTAAQHRGMSKDALLSCDWAALRPSHANLADWPLLQSLAARNPSRPFAMAKELAAAGSPQVEAEGSAKRHVAPDCGVEERKGSEPPAPPPPPRDATRDGCDHVSGGCGASFFQERDEWIVVTLDAPGGGVGLLDKPLGAAKVACRLASGQVAQLLPPPQSAGGGRASTAETAQSSGWRQVGGLGGEGGWLALSAEDAATFAPTLERFWSHRIILDWFSRGAKCGRTGSRLGAGAAGTEETSPCNASTENFWVPLRQGCSLTATASGGVSGATVTPSSVSPLILEGDSDALLLSAADMLGTPEEGESSEREGEFSPSDGQGTGSLLVTGKWKIGLVTDMLTVATRTSGCTKRVPSVAAEDDALADAGSGASASLDSGGGGSKADNGQLVGPLPVLVDGLVFGFRAADGLLVVTTAFSRSEGGRANGGKSTTDRRPPHARMETVERNAVASLGGVEEGAEVSFSVVDAGKDVVFCCREVGGRRRAATVRARCGDTWGRGRVGFGVRSAKQDATSGWVRVVSQAYGATVRSGISIDADGIVSRIPCGAVVPYDNAIIYHSQGAPDQAGIDPVVRYRCIATATTPAGWISERGRSAEHPYSICERVLPRTTKQLAHALSHVSVGRVCSPAAAKADGCHDLLLSALPLPRAGHTTTGGRGGEGPGKVTGREDKKWQRRLDDLSVLSARFHLLQQVNLGVSKALRYVNLSQGDLPWSLAALFSRCRHLIFSVLKQELWQAELARTARSLPPHTGAVGADGETSVLELRLSRGRAAGHARPNEGHRAGEGERHTLFGQAFLALRNAPVEAFRLRPSEVLYSTVFLGEHAHDAGGELPCIAVCGLADPCDVCDRLKSVYVFF